MGVVEAQHFEIMWILLAPLTPYVSKLGALAPRLGFFFFALNREFAHGDLGGG